MFSYSIRMRLLPDGCTLDSRQFNSCQLSSRHWIIRCDETVIADFSGEAVIGKVKNRFFSSNYGSLATI